MAFPALELTAVTDEVLLCEAAALVDDGAAAIRLCGDRNKKKPADADIARIRAFCAGVFVPVYYSGPVCRLEDIKKLLYAGVEAVILDPGTGEERSLFAEAASRFGADRVLASEPVYPPAPAFSWQDLRPGTDGLVPCITQEEGTGEVLMLAYMNEEAFEKTVRTGRMTYWSRSRGELWVKGLTSGHFQYLRSLRTDCDMDTLLAVVRQKGAACHTGAHNCFFHEILRTGHENTDPRRILDEVYAVISDRKEHPREGSYTNYLFDSGIDKILKKVGEEAAETIIAAKNPDPQESVYEIADLLYHLMVLMKEKGLSWREITDELAMRD